MVMKQKSYSWVFRYYNIKTGEISYRTFRNWTIGDAKRLADSFVGFNKDYSVEIYKIYKKF